MPDIIHHYTTIETLALILKHRTLRFTRLDHVDDVREAQTVAKIQFGKCLFASCWTRSAEESIPLWKMYANEMTGVRISLPVRMFKWRPLTPDPARGLAMEGTISSPIPFEKLFSTSYLLIPTFLDEAHFFGGVVYDDGVEEAYRAACEFTPTGFSVRNPCGLARLKKRVWSFQDECRFVLFAVPPIPCPQSGRPDTEFWARMAQVVGNAMASGNGAEVAHIDIDLDEAVLDEIVVTTGPLCSDGHHLIAENLVERFSARGQVRRSSLAGSIRTPRR